MYRDRILNATDQDINKMIATSVVMRKNRKGKLLATATEVESRGVCTTREQPSILASSRTREKASRDPSQKGQLNKENPAKGRTPSCEGTQAGSPLRAAGNDTGGQSTNPAGHRNRLSHQELDPALRINIPGRTQDLASESTASAKQEIIHLSIARQALEAEKAELKRLLDQRENIITELRKQMHHRDKTIQVQRAQFEDAIRNLQNGKRTISMGETALTRGSPGIGGGTREELQLVRDAIISLRSNFRGTDPNQHTLDTLEQAIAVLIERCGGLTSVGGTGGVGAGSGGNGSPGSGGLANGVISTSTDKSSRSADKRLQVNGVVESSTKVIYFTERTVTPFMSTINKRLGEIRLRDFKNMFDRPGLFRFHFKSHDPEYGMVKEEIVNDDDILPGVEGKIIAWVEEDTD